MLSSSLSPLDWQLLFSSVASYYGVLPHRCSVANMASLCYGLFSGIPGNLQIAQRKMAVHGLNGQFRVNHVFGT